MHELLLIKQQSRTPMRKTISQSTPLHLATGYGRHECVEHLLLNDQVDPNAEEVEDIKRTALHVACAK